MKTKLRILLLEDQAADAELIAETLEASGFSFSLGRIQTEAELRRELEFGRPDLILSDHGLPSFDGFKALEIVRHTHPELPFIFVSASNDPGMVAEMYEQGATNYVFKTDLADLRTAVREALVMPTTNPLPDLSVIHPAVSATPPKPLGETSVGTVRFCPTCREMRDEAGTTIRPVDFFQTHLETTVLRVVCARCQDARQSR